MTGYLIYQTTHFLHVGDSTYVWQCIWYYFSFGKPCFNVFIV